MDASGAWRRAFSFFFFFSLRFPFAICSSPFVVFMIIRTRTGNGMVWKARPRQDDGFVDVSSIGS